MYKWKCSITYFSTLCSRSLTALVWTSSLSVVTLCFPVRLSRSHSSMCYLSTFFWCLRQICLYPQWITVRLSVTASIRFFNHSVHQFCTLLTRLFFFLKASCSGLRSSFFIFSFPAFQLTNSCNLFARSTITCEVVVKKQSNIF